MAIRSLAGARTVKLRKLERYPMLTWLTKTCYLLYVGTLAPVIRFNSGSFKNRRCKRMGAKGNTKDRV